MTAVPPRLRPAVPDPLERAADPRSLTVEMPAGRPTGEWGMVLFVTTEATFFACLIASYFYVRFVHGGPWPQGGIEQPKLLKAAIMTVLLVSSTAPMIWADRAIRKGRTRQTGVALALTALCGIAFLLTQASEWHENLRKYTWDQNAYASLQYTITGFHGAHVTIGVVMLLVTLVALLRGKFTGRRNERVRMVAVYWHFVDAVWVAILLSLYLSPRLGGS